VTISAWALDAVAGDVYKLPGDFLLLPAVMCLKSIRDAKQLLAKLNDNDDKAPLAPADSTLAKAPTN
jgi:hypothetical protein